MVFCSFHFLPIFLLAQILMRADLGDSDALRKVEDLMGAGEERGQLARKVRDELIGAWGQTLDGDGRGVRLVLARKGLEEAGREHGPVVGRRGTIPCAQPVPRPRAGVVEQRSPPER